MNATLPPPLALRTVVFLTVGNHPSIPHAANSPACLLPMAWASFAERVMHSCAMAGLQEVDVVACDHPEQLRRALGLGQRWGLRLTWHLVKEGSAPYGVLRQLASSASRVIVGHAQAWIDETALAELVRDDCTAVVLEPSLQWTGWASMPAAAAAAVPQHADAQTLAELMLAQRGQGRRCLALLPQQTLAAGSAQDLLQVQSACLQASALQAAPASWLHKPWGLLSAEAHLHPTAVVNGPAVIGPGCVVEADVSIGPNTVLYRDVMLARGASVESSLVLTGTYVGTDVLVLNTVVQGNVAQHVGWGVQQQPPATDAELAPLRPKTPRRWLLPALAGRGLASALLLLGLPAWVALALVSRMQGRCGQWVLSSAVQGWNVDGTLQLLPVRLGNRHGGWVSASIGNFGALLDVVQGRRAWFGVRPRKPSDWYTLNRDWQRLLAQQPIGFFQAQAWAGDEGAGCAEAQAVADACFAASRSLRERFSVISGAVRSWRPGAHCAA